MLVSHDKAYAQGTNQGKATKAKQRDLYKVWLTDDEVEQLRRAAVSRRDDLII